MPVPKTFSAPGDETFPSLNGFAPSPEDSLLFAVWLMLTADDVNREAYSGRIYMGRPEYDPQTLTLTLPCQLVQVRVGNLRWEYFAGRGGKLTIDIGVAHIEPNNTSKINPDVVAPSITAETRLDRMRQILMHGTIYKATQERFTGKVIHPYLTPRNGDGTYGTPLVWLAEQGPDIEPTLRVTFPNKRVRSPEDEAKLLPGDFGVSYGWLARYTVNVRNRDTMQ